MAESQIERQLIWAEKQVESLRTQVAELKAENEWLHTIRDECDERGIDIDILVKECDELKRQNAALLVALDLWKVAGDNAEESELDDMACYCIPMPLFCDAYEATEAIDAALAATKGES